MADIDISNAFDWASVSEDLYYRTDIVIPVNTYESVSVLDVESINNTFLFGVEQIADGYPRMPVRKIEASFAPAFASKDNLRAPASYGQGYFGGTLSKKAPGQASAGKFKQPTVFMTVRGKESVRRLESAFGAVLSGRIPVRSISAESSTGGLFSLDKKQPIRSISASFTIPTAFTLNAKIPLWVVSITMDTPVVYATLNSASPGAFIISASMSEAMNFSLDGSAPVRRLTSSFYHENMALDSYIPVWVMHGVLAGALQESSRFNDYVLRYTRP